MIKFWAWIYRRTGWMCPLVKIYEYRALWNEIDRIWKSHKGKHKCKISREFLSTYIGLWQAQHGFTRSYRVIKRNAEIREMLDPFIKALKTTPLKNTRNI